MGKSTQKLSARSNNRSRTPHSEQFLKFVGSGWLAEDGDLPTAGEFVEFTAARRDAVAKKFKGKVVVIEAGDLKVRSNDTDYRFRPHSAFAHLTGWGAATVPGSVLVIDARTKLVERLYLRPTAGHDTDEFFANPQVGEFWVGKRPSLAQVSALLAIETRDIKNLEADLGDVTKTQRLTLSSSADLVEFVSELRLVKDAYEIAQMRLAIDATKTGFESVIRALPKATETARGERIIETAFFTEARAHGNDLGYDTIAAAGPNACTLHWIINDGQVKNGDLILVDAGVEVDSLYTADITRTLPINGKFNETQKMIYEAVLEAADAAFAVAKPGAIFRDVHNAAIEVIARKVEQWGLLPVSAEESLEPDNQFHRRWMVHGTSHHLGLDVHDCAAARRELYLDGELKPGMIFTIEPGLYFHANDALVPAEFRGIGIRIEDNVLVTETGLEHLSSDLPRSVAAIEEWIAKLQAN